MGWTGTYRTTAEVEQAVIGKPAKIGATIPEYDDAGIPTGKTAGTILDVKRRGAAIWLLIDWRGTVAIMAIRLRGTPGAYWEGGLWGEDSGPYYYGAPVEWYDRAPLPKTHGKSEEWAKRWREDNRQWCETNPDRLIIERAA